MIHCLSTNETVETYKDYLNTKHWLNKKESFKKTVINECMLCKSKDHLHVHHLTYKNIGNESNSELSLLCRECHYQSHELGRDKLNEIYIMRKNQRKIDIKRIKNGSNWLSNTEFKTEEEYLENRNKIKMNTSSGVEDKRERRKKAFKYIADKYISNEYKDEVKNWHYLNKNKKKHIRISKEYSLILKSINSCDIYDNDGNCVEKIRVSNKKFS